MSPFINGWQMSLLLHQKGLTGSKDTRDIVGDAVVINTLNLCFLPGPFWPLSLWRILAAVCELHGYVFFFSNCMIVWCVTENSWDYIFVVWKSPISVVWQISWESATIGFWFTDLLDRHAQFTSWLFEGRPNVFWMTGFFNPQGFLTAMRQEITRAHKGWALDAVVLDNDVTKLMKEDITSPPSEGNSNGSAEDVTDVWTGLSVYLSNFQQIMG